MSARGDRSPLFKPIGTVAAELGVRPHVLRYWQERFPEVAPIAGAGGRRYYRAADIALLRALRHLLHEQRMTLEGVRRLIDRDGAAVVARQWGDVGEGTPGTGPTAPGAPAPELLAELRAIRDRLAVTLGAPA